MTGDAIELSLNPRFEQRPQLAAELACEERLEGGASRQTQSGVSLAFSYSRRLKSPEVPIALTV